MAKLEPNAETFRLRALARLIRKDVGQARLEIRKALELKPRWESVLHVAGMVDYFSALAPAALPDRIVPWPEPVDWVMVRRDDESAQRLRMAERTFRELAEASGKEGEERRAHECWCLASMANNRNRQEEARDYCQSLLESDPAHPQAVVWATARQFEADLSRSEKTLRGLACREGATVPQVLALVSIYLGSGRSQEALTLLDESRPLFAGDDARTLWTSWRARCLVASEQPADALSLIRSSGVAGELRGVKVLALRELARQTGQYGDLLSYLEASYEETNAPLFLFEACNIRSQQKDWAYVAERAERLVAQMATADAVQLAAIGSFNAGRWRVCLNLLDDSQHLFPQGMLPGQLRRIRSFCLRHLGILPEAIAEAEALARDEPTPENLLALAALHAESGDFDGLSIVARRLSAESDLEPVVALRLAWQLQHRDAPLAQKLWRRAVLTGLPDDGVGVAVALGYQLGLDDELEELFRRMAELGAEGRGGIQAKTLQDLLQMMNSHRERREVLDRAYGEGNAPVHLVAGMMNIPLVELYHRALLENEAAPDPMRQCRLLARHGGRTVVAGFPNSVPGARLHLDITAVLLAEHLGVVERTAETLGPLRLPPQVIPALADMQRQMLPHQPRRLETLGEVLRQCDDGRIEITVVDLAGEYGNTELVEELGAEWVALFEHARATRGHVVCNLPLRALLKECPPSALPNDAGNHVVNCRAVADALRQHGPLSDKAHQSAVAALHGAGNVVDGVPVPAPGTVLICARGTAEQLAEARLLKPACSRFRLYIHEQELMAMRRELEESRRRAETAGWLDALIAKLRDGLQQGTIETISLPPDAEVEPEADGPNLPAARCLRALLQFKSQPGDVIWVDDRCVNSYFHREGVPIIGVNDVLKALVAAGTIQPAKYYEKLHRLRAGNIRFVPVEGDDVLFHLAQASVSGDAMVETHELGVLRRYVAACALQGHLLQEPPAAADSPNPRGEMPFLIGIGAAIADVLVGLWECKEYTEDARHARAQWVLDNLHVDHLGLLHATSLRRPSQSDLFLLSHSLAGLVGRAIVLDWRSRDQEESPRKRYFEWLTRHLLAPRFDARPDLVPAVADALKKSITNVRGEQLQDEESEAVGIAILQAFYDDLPSVLREEVAKDSDFLADIGIAIRPVLLTAGLEFAPDEFWRAAEGAMNGRESSVSPLGMDSEVVLTPLPTAAQRPGFSFAHPRTGETRTIDWPELGLLSRSPSEREATLREDRAWFDCDEETFQELVANVASVEDPRVRMESLDSWRKGSAALHYVNLRGRLAKREKVTFADTRPPSAAGLLRHFRLPAGAVGGLPLKDCLSVAARTLIDQEGIEAAVVRLACFPVSLPDCLMDAVAGISREDRRSLLKRLLRGPATPLSRVHLARILVAVREDNPAYARLAKRLVTGLMGDRAQTDFEGFLTLLKWVNDDFCRWQESRDWPPALRLAMEWGHAHRLFSVLVSVGLTPEWVTETFAGWRERVPLDIFERTPDGWLDVAHPRNVVRLPFVLAGLAHALGDTARANTDRDFQGMLLAEVFPEIGEGRIPAPALLRDVSQGSNCLDSFLAARLGVTLPLLVSDERGGLWGGRALQDLARAEIAALQEDSLNPSAWVMLHAVISDFPLAGDLTERLEELIAQTSFVELFGANERCGVAAFSAAASQAAHLGRADIRNKLRDELLGVARLLAEQGTGQPQPSTDEEAEDRLWALRAFLIAWSLDVSVRGQPAEAGVADFAALLDELIQAWPAVGETAWPALQRFCLELPPSQAKQLWHLLLRARAE